MNDEIKKIITDIIDSKTASKIYDDGLKNSVSETGNVLTDTIKTLRLFSAPLQLAAAYQDRLSVWIDRTIRKVPAENRIQAAPGIAGPIFDELRYLEDGNIISEMYLSLLAKAIDKENINLAHPAFVKIIGHLSPDEALILHHLRKKPYEEHYHSVYDREGNRFHGKEIIYQEFPTDELIYPSNFYVYTSHLMSLDLVKFPVYKQEPTFEDTEQTLQNGETGYAYLHLTDFGHMFVHACEPSVNSG
ncbi:DUF4393 domain-containing protein [Microbulbifer sp. VAAC004]|uniref:DUF4393 domain-containing protein n=1 Tax=unclassified Microbulbifer TaxID=2619833 RepID=UPI0040390D21